MRGERVIKGFEDEMFLNLFEHVNHKQRVREVVFLIGVDAVPMLIPDMHLAGSMSRTIMLDDVSQWGESRL